VLQRLLRAPARLRIEVLQQKACRSQLNSEIRTVWLFNAKRYPHLHTFTAAELLQRSGPRQCCNQLVLLGEKPYAGTTLAAGHLAEALPSWRREDTNTQAIPDTSCACSQIKNFQT
jgi:hypothetical protein